MFAQDPAFYRKVRVDETDDPEALRRLMELEAIDAIRRWFTLAEALSAPGVGRSTHYERKRRLREEGVKGLVPRSSRPKSHPGRQRTKADAKRVLEVRREMLWAGKARIAPELPERCPAGASSKATTGLILRWVVETRRAQRCSFAKGGPSRKQRRDFEDSHAKRWTRDDWHLGVQADHMTLRSARRWALPLKVLPTELSGMVERTNRSERIEYWSQHRGEVACAALNESPTNGVERGRAGHAGSFAGESAGTTAAAPVPSRAFTKRFRLTPSSAAASTSDRCTSGGTRTTNLPLYLRSASGAGGRSPVVAISSRMSHTSLRMPASASSGEAANQLKDGNSTHKPTCS